MIDTSISQNTTTANSYNNLLTFDDQSLRQVQAQYNEQIKLAFSMNTKKKRIYKKKSKPKQLIVIPILNKSLNENRFFYLYAGIILPCDFSYEARGIIIEKQQLMQACTPLAKIEKRTNLTLLSYSHNFKGLEHFDFLIDIYMRKGNQNYHNLAQILKQFQVNIQLWKNSSEIMANQRLSNPEEYKLKYKTFMNDCLKKVDQMDQSKFYLCGFVMYNYESKNLEQKTVGFSQGMLSLLGTDQDQFEQINLRSGMPNNYIGEKLLNALIISLLPLTKSSFIYEKTAADNVLLTLDGFEVPYTEIRTYTMPEENKNLGYVEICFGLIELDVSISALQQLLTLRAKRYYEDKIREFEDFENFEYSMNSQLFIEKFYPHAITNDFQRCRSKQIDENNKNNNNFQIISTIQQSSVNIIDLNDGIQKQKQQILSSTSCISDQEKLINSNNSNHFVPFSYQDEYTTGSIENQNVCQQNKYLQNFNFNKNQQELGYSMIIEQQPFRQNTEQQLTQPNLIQNQISHINFNIISNYNNNIFNYNNMNNHNIQSQDELTNIQELDIQFEPFNYKDMN